LCCGGHVDEIQSFTDVENVGKTLRVIGVYQVFTAHINFVMIVSFGCLFMQFTYLSRVVGFGLGLRSKLLLTSLLLLLLVTTADGKITLCGACVCVCGACVCEAKTEVGVGR